MKCTGVGAQWTTQTDGQWQMTLFSNEARMASLASSVENSHGVELNAARNEMLNYVRNKTSLQEPVQKCF